MPKGVYPRKYIPPRFEKCVDCSKALHKRNKSGYCLPCATKRRTPTRYWLGKKRPDMSAKQLGKVFSEETKRRLSESHKGNVGYWKGRTRPDMQGANSSNWKGGHVKHPDKAIRMSYQYIAWRTAVFTRDDYTCQACGQHGGRLQADHELPFALFPDLRFEVLNGRTLCVPCHFKTPTYGRGATAIHSFVTCL